MYIECYLINELFVDKKTSQDFGENTYCEIEDNVCIIIPHKTLVGTLSGIMAG